MSLTRIPLVVHGPGIPRQRVLSPVQHIDLFVGLLRRIGARVPASCRGVDLFDVAADERDGRPLERPVLTEGQLYREPRVAVTDGRDRLIVGMRRQWKALWRTNEVGVASERRSTSPTTPSSSGCSG